MVALALWDRSLKALGVFIPLAAPRAPLLAQPPGLLVTIYMPDTCGTSSAEGRAVRAVISFVSFVGLFTDASCQ